MWTLVTYFEGKKQTKTKIWDQDSKKKFGYKTDKIVEWKPANN